MAAGLIVAFGYSDDNLELRGAMDDEISAYDGAEITIRRDSLKVVESGTCPECGSTAPVFGISAKWCPSDPAASWLITASGAPFDPGGGAVAAARPHLAAKRWSGARRRWQNCSCRVARGRPSPTDAAGIGHLPISHSLPVDQAWGQAHAAAAFRHALDRLVLLSLTSYDAYT